MISINLMRPKLIIPRDGYIDCTNITATEKAWLKRAGLSAMSEDIERQLKTGGR